MGGEQQPVIETKERTPARLKVTILRHAETKYNKEKRMHRISPEHDDELTDEGRAHYQKIAAQLAESVSSQDEVVVYASDFARSAYSADIIVDALRKKGKKIRVHGFFRKKMFKTETNLGKVRKWHWKPVTALMEGGETEYEGTKFFVDPHLTNPHDLRYPEFFTQGGIQKIPQLAMEHWPKGFIREIKEMETYVEVTRRMIQTLHDIQRKYAGGNHHVVIVTHRALMHFLGDFFTRGRKVEFGSGESIELETYGSKLVAKRVGGHNIQDESDIFKAFRKSKSKMKQGKAVITIGEVVRAVS